MWKLFFANKEVMDIVVTAVIGDHAKDRYYFIHTQRSTENSPDAVYLSRTASFPPIMIGVQHTVDLKCYLTLISQGASTTLHYYAPPVFVMFATSSLIYDIKKRTVKHRSMPFLKQIRSCFPWASSCYFITNDFIEHCLIEEPLHRFVALSFFVLNLPNSPAENPYCLDPTMAQLHIITEKIVYGEAQLINRSMLNLCIENQRSVINTISSLDEFDLSQTTKQIVRESLEDDVRLYDAYLAKYNEQELYLASLEAGLISEAVPFSSTEIMETFPVYPSIESSEVTPSEFSSIGVEATPVPSAYPFIGSLEIIPELFTHPSLEISEATMAPLAYSSSESSEAIPIPPAHPCVKNASLPIRDRSENWDYINRRLSEIDENAMIPWNDISSEGKTNGYFNTFKNSNTLRSTYYQSKKRSN